MTLDEKLERAKDTEYHLQEAMYHLEQCDGMDNVIDTIKNCLIVQHFAVEQYQKRIEERRARIDMELMAEYWRAR